MGPPNTLGAANWILSRQKCHCLTYAYRLFEPVHVSHRSMTCLLQVPAAWDCSKLHKLWSESSYIRLLSAAVPNGPLAMGQQSLHDAAAAVLSRSAATGCTHVDASHASLALRRKSQWVASALLACAALHAGGRVTLLFCLLACFECCYQQLQSLCSTMRATLIGLIPCVCIDAGNSGNRKVTQLISQTWVTRALWHWPRFEPWLAITGGVPVFCRLRTHYKRVGSGNPWCVSLLYRTP
jgi:hypothetical protein